MNTGLIVKETSKGRGVFTLQSIIKGQLITEWKGERLSVDDIPHPYQSAFDLYTQIGPRIYIGPSGGLDDLINHSCEPNSGLFFEGQDIYCKAIRDINPNEEISWDYSTTMDEAGIQDLDNWEMECYCGSPKCRKIIKGFNTIPKYIQKNYIDLGIVPEYVALQYLP